MAAGFCESESMSRADPRQESQHFAWEFRWAWREEVCAWLEAVGGVKSTREEQPPYAQGQADSLL